MGFKMKGINSLIRRASSNSPLLNTDPEIENTKFTKTKDGDIIPVERTITTPGDRTVEKQTSSNQAFLDSFAPEFAKAKEGGFPGTLPEYINQKEIDLGYAGSKVDQVRDYTSGLITKPGSEFENRFFKQRKGWADGYSDEAFEMGGFLAGKLNEGLDEDKWGTRASGRGSGDAKRYITENEAMELYRKYNNPHQPNKGITGDKKDRKMWINNYYNWRNERGLPETSMSYQKDYEPTSYEDNDSLTEWTKKQNN